VLVTFCCVQIGTEPMGVVGYWMLVVPKTAPVSLA
jgi:hypothetical protein